MAIRTIGGEEFHRRVRQGARERNVVIAELFRLHYAELVSRLVYKGVPLQIAEERANDVFLGLFRHCEKLSPSTPPIHYLNRAVSNAVCDYHASSGRRSPPSDPSPSTQGDGEPPDPEEAVNAPDHAHMAAGAPTFISVDDESAMEIPDQRAGNQPDFELERKQKCAYRVVQIFERELPEAHEVLSAYALDEMDIEEARVAMRAKSVQAARQRMYTWRAKLKALCLDLCGDEHCADAASPRGVDGKR